MRRCVNIAMSILGRSRNRAAMSTYSTELVDVLEADKRTTTAGDLNTYDEMPNVIDNWLNVIANEFPEIYINHALRDSYAQTGRLTWGTEWHKYET